MPGNIRTATLKNVILLISTIVISLAITLCYSENAFAEEPLTEASVVTESGDTQQEESNPEVGSAEAEAGPPTEGWETEDAGQYVAVEDDVVYADTASEEIYGNAVDETARPHIQSRKRK